jgi:hypothetical protein
VMNQEHNEEDAELRRVRSEAHISRERHPRHG